MKLMRHFWRFVLAVVTRVSDGHFGLVAAGVAFYAMFAVFPGLAAVVAIWGLMADPQVIGGYLAVAERFLPPDAARLVHDQVMGLLAAPATALGWTTLVSLAIALYSARAGVSALIQGLDVVHRARPRGWVWGYAVDFLLTAKRDLDAAKRFFRKMLKDEPLLSPNRIGTDGANTFPSTIKTSVDDGLLHPDPVHYVTKHLQQGIESDHFRVKKNMPKIGGFQSFNTARRTIAGFEAMLWLRKGFGFSGGWTVNDQNDLLARLFGLQKVNKA